MPQNVPGKKPAITAGTLLDNAEQLTFVERAELFEQWVLKSLDELLQYAESNRGFGKHMCKMIDERLGENTYLSSMLLRSLHGRREGQKRGNKPSGAVYWDRTSLLVLLAEYKPNGKEGLLSFGGYPCVSLAVARKMRDEAKLLLLEGVDPVERKRKAKAEAARTALTFKTVALAWYAEMSRKWSAQHAANVLKRLETYLFPYVGHRPIIELDTHDLLEPLEKLKQRGTLDVASRVQQYVQSIMRDAKRARMIESNPALDLAGVIKPKKIVHRPALPLKQLPDLLTRLDGYQGRELTRLAVLLTLHVFVRSSELRFARWREFDLDRAIWEIPDT